MNDTLFITKTGVAYSSKVGGGDISGGDEANVLLAGAIAFIETDGTLVPDDGSAALSDPWQFTIELGRETEGQDLGSMPIWAKTLKMKKQVYVAPVAEVEILGYDGTTVGSAFSIPSPLVVGSSYGVTITLVDGPVYKMENKYTYSLTVVTGDTAATIIAKLAAAINADATLDITAAVTGTVTADLKMTLTCGTAGQPFNAMCTGILESSSRDFDAAVNSTAVVIGKGTEAQVLEKERKFKAHLGIDDTNENIPGLSAYKSMVVAGSTYTSYLLEWTTDRVSQSFNKAANMPLFCEIYVPSGDAAIIASLDAIFTDILTVYP